MRILVYDKSLDMQQQQQQTESLWPRALLASDGEHVPVRARVDPARSESLVRAPHLRAIQLAQPLRVEGMTLSRMVGAQVLLVAAGTNRFGAALETLLFVPEQWPAHERDYDLVLGADFLARWALHLDAAHSSLVASSAGARHLLARLVPPD